MSTLGERRGMCNCRVGILTGVFLFTQVYLKRCVQAGGQHMVSFAMHLAGLLMGDHLPRVRQPRTRQPRTRKQHQLMPRALTYEVSSYGHAPRRGQRAPAQVPLGGD